MRCSSCNQDNIESNLFCIYCGVPLAAAAGPKERDTGEDAAEVPTEELSLAELQKEVGRLNEEIREVYRTLSDYGIRPSIERPLRDPVERQPPPVERTPVPDMASPARTPSPPPSSPSRPQATPSRPAPTPSRPVPSDVPRERIKVDWELILGGNWLARIGVLAVVIGVAFFLKLAFDNQWIGEAGRVALGVTGGIGLLIAGELLHRRYPIYAQALLGGGIAILYVSIFAAFSFYGLLDIYPAAGLLFLFSVTAAAARPQTRLNRPRRHRHIGCFRRAVHPRRLPSKADGAADIRQRCQRPDHGLRRNSRSRRAGPLYRSQLAMVHPPGASRVAGVLWHLVRRIR